MKSKLIDYLGLDLTIGENNNYLYIHTYIRTHSQHTLTHTHAFKHTHSSLAREHTHIQHNYRGKSILEAVARTIAPILIYLNGI